MRSVEGLRGAGGALDWLPILLPLTLPEYPCRPRLPQESVQHARLRQVVNPPLVENPPQKNPPKLPQSLLRHGSESASRGCQVRRWSSDLEVGAGDVCRVSLRSRVNSPRAEHTGEVVKAALELAQPFLVSHFRRRGVPSSDQSVAAT